MALHRPLHVSRAEAGILVSRPHHTVVAAGKRDAPRYTA